MHIQSSMRVGDTWGQGEGQRLPRVEVLGGKKKRGGGFMKT
jgi:hypothetical protein